MDKPEITAEDVMNYLATGNLDPVKTLEIQRCLDEEPESFAAQEVSRIQQFGHNLLDRVSQVD